MIEFKAFKSDFNGDFNGGLGIMVSLVNISDDGDYNSKCTRNDC